MRAHDAIVEAGPGGIRQLCCGADASADAEVAGAALDAIDDGVALIGERPVAVASLWCAALRALPCVPGNRTVVVHPSWWSSSRVDVARTAAGALTGDVVTRPRSWLLLRASATAPGATAVAEIAERLAVVVGATTVAIPRRGEPGVVAQRVVRAIAGMGADAVVIDAAGAAPGAVQLAALIADRLRDGAASIVQVDRARLIRLARPDLHPTCPGPSGPVAQHRRAWSGLGKLAAGAGGAVALTVVSLAGFLLGAPGVGERPRAVAAHPISTAAALPAAFLVEGRVALTVPADWVTQRVVAGPGSARVQVTSPSDPEVALHITQSPDAGEPLSATAARLKRAIDAEPAGVFVDFDPAGVTGGRPAVTYRELRAAHHVRWTVLVDGPVRISIGCQSRPDGAEAIREACEQAVRSAHAIGV